MRHAQARHPQLDPRLGLVQIGNHLQHLRRSHPAEAFDLDRVKRFVHRRGLPRISYTARPRHLALTDAGPAAPGRSRANVTPVGGWIYCHPGKPPIWDIVLYVSYYYQYSTIA